MHHVLKIEDSYYDAKVEGLKLFEIRYNDRGFQKGDTVSYTKPIGSLQRSGVWEIIYVTGYQQRENFVVFGEKRIK